VFEPEGPKEDYGTEDPRVAYNEKERMYYMMYSAVASKPKIVSKLSLAKTATPWVKGSWER